jgi:hypothetical protein
MVYVKITGRIFHFIQMLLDRFFDTHINRNFLSSEFLLFADIGELDLCGIDRSYARELLRMWFNHRFDLLGSGWVRCGFFDNAPGIEGYRYPGLVLDIDTSGKWLRQILAQRNTASAIRIWRQIPANYQPIDWQKDFKSGYRWNTKQWYRLQEWADKPGGDIKVPWELSRLQHLPRMAIFAHIFSEDKEEIVQEFRSQCLDFIAQNPPRMGVNWNCTMDVGIRTANMVLAYSLFCTGGCTFDKEFNQIFVRSIYEHCYHIHTNLEWSEYLTSNHYLANIAGLLFGAAFLPPSLRKKKWLNFASIEIKNEIIKQFYAEGTNFEGSTAYHRLSTDLGIYSIALISSLEHRSPDVDISNRLYGAAKFLQAVTRPDNSFSQIGDNDSGLFFRLSSTGSLLHAEDVMQKYRSLSGYSPEIKGEDYLDENMNDGRTTISAVSGLFANDDFPQERKVYPLEYSMTRMLCSGYTAKSNWKPFKSFPIILSNDTPEFEYHKKTEISSNGIMLLSGLHRIDFPKFGLYIFRSETLYLLVNVADNGQKGNGGHAHNDKLSFELFINSLPLYEDPGTYVYTALPEQRNKYRSVFTHNTIHANIEQNEYINLFSMSSQTKCTLLDITDCSISLIVEYYNIVHHRKFEIKNEKIIVTDDCNIFFFAWSKPCRKTVGYGKMEYYEPKQFWSR